MRPLRHLFFIVWLAACPAEDAFAFTYYVSPAGNDDNTGASQEEAWQTLGRVAGGNYQPGDRILLEGGHTFHDSLFFSPDTFHGTADRPVEISSYGEGRATIASGNESGIAAFDISGLKISHVNFEGTFPAFAGILIDNSSRTRAEGFTISDVDIHGYANAMFVSAFEKPSKIAKIRIEKVRTYDNAIGPSFYGQYTVAAVINDEHFGIEDLYISELESFNNSGKGVPNFGSGLSIMNARDVQVLFSKIYNNGGESPSIGEGNGASGILMYDGYNVGILGNEIYGQKYTYTTQTDNAGMDIWARKYLVANNYIHDNHGWGALVGGTDPRGEGSGHGFWPNEEGVFMYNVFENNATGRREEGYIPYDGAAFFIFGLVKDLFILNNTIYSAQTGDALLEQGMISIIHTPPLDPPNVFMLNNLLIADGDRTFFEVNTDEAAERQQIANNAYIGGSDEKAVLWGSGVYGKIHEWSAATGQETIDGKYAAVLARHNSVCESGRQGTLNPRPLFDMAAYKLRRKAPMIDAGIVFDDPLNERRDFFGTPVPFRKGTDIGAHEYVPYEGGDCVTYGE